MEGDERSFEIWHEREDSVRKYTLQARTVNIKISWLKDISGIQQRFSIPAWSKYLTNPSNKNCASNLWLVSEKLYIK